MIGIWALTTLGPLGHDAGEVRARAEERLSRPPFVTDPPGPIRRLLRAVGDAVADVLAEAFGGVGAGILPWILVVLGTAALTWLVWRITRGVSADRSVAEVPPDTVLRSATAWHADADAAEARGEFREALRCRYAAMVATLIAEGALEDVPGRTVRELDAETARAMPTIAADVAAAGQRFERAVYGHLELAASDLEVVARAARLVSERTGPRRTGERA